MLIFPSFRLRALSDGNNPGTPPPSPGIIGKYKLADYRYGKEEMLALNNPNHTEPLEEIKKFTYIYVEKPQEPITMQSLSEEEQVHIWYFLLWHHFSLICICLHNLRKKVFLLFPHMNNAYQFLLFCVKIQHHFRLNVKNISGNIILWNLRPLAKAYKKYMNSGLWIIWNLN